MVFFDRSVFKNQSSQKYYSTSSSSLEPRLKRNSHAVFTRDRTKATGNALLVPRLKRNSHAVFTRDRTKATGNALLVPRLKRNSHAVFTRDRTKETGNALLAPRLKQNSRVFPSGYRCIFFSEEFKKVMNSKKPCRICTSSFRVLQGFKEFYRASRMFPFKICFFLKSVLFSVSSASVLPGLYGVQNPRFLSVPR